MGGFRASERSGSARRCRHVRIVADSHAVVWHLQGSDRLSDIARETIAGAVQEKALVVSTATIIDLWYVSQTTKGVTEEDLADLRHRLSGSDAVTFEPITVAVAGASMTIPRSVLGDPWDRLIVATAMALTVPLVTRDGRIRNASVVETIW